MDGKGVLPLEFVSHSDYRLISPDFLLPIATMEADTVADTLVDVFNDADNDKFWADSARYMLRMAAVVIKASNQAFTLNEIQRFCTGTNADRMAILDAIEEKINDDAQLYIAVMYWMQDFINMPEKTSGSIVNMIRTWLGNITAHQELGVWCDTSPILETSRMFLKVKKWGWLCLILAMALEGLRFRLCVCVGCMMRQKTR